MLSALVICAGLVHPCDERNAVDIFFGPRTASMHDCLRSAQAYVAETSLMRLGDTLRVFCGPAAQIRARFGTI